jgi:hypothetical protein
MLSSAVDADKKPRRLPGEALSDRSDHPSTSVGLIASDQIRRVIRPRDIRTDLHSISAMSQGNEARLKEAGATIAKAGRDKSNTLYIEIIFQIARRDRRHACSFVAHPL